MNHTHRLTMPSHEALGRLDRRYGTDVRYWFAAGGSLVGIWRGKNGRTYAVGHDMAGRTIVYRACAPHDGWGNYPRTRRCRYCGDDRPVAELCRCR